MSLHISQTNGGGIAFYVATEHTRTQTLGIAPFIVGGLCTYLVNGRDISDALAPMEALASCIKEAVGDKWVQIEDLPPWITEALNEEEIQAELPDPIVRALSNLEMLGGEKQMIVLEGVK